MSDLNPPVFKHNLFCLPNQGFTDPSAGFFFFFPMNDDIHRSRPAMTFSGRNDSEQIAGDSDQVGADFQDFFDDLESGLLAKGVQVLQVWLKLTCPWVDEAVEILRFKGYFIGGLLPRWFDRDGLLMQKIIGQPNWDGINIYSDWAKKILELVKADWERSE